MALKERQEFGSASVLRRANAAADFAAVGHHNSYGPESRVFFAICWYDLPAASIGAGLRGVQEYLAAMLQ